MKALGISLAGNVAAHLHYVSNETVEGLQFPNCDRRPNVPLIAGVTVAVLDRSLLERIPDGLPAILDFRTHISHVSNFNTPPVFAIYVLTLVTRWLRFEVGGLEAMQAVNLGKARRLYGALDCLDGVVSIHAANAWRSQMNVAFTFGDSRLDDAFIATAREHRIVGLEGHRSIGGLRASLYNAVTPNAVDVLADALMEFGARRTLANDSIGGGDATQERFKAIAENLLKRAPCNCPTLDLIRFAGRSFTSSCTSIVVHGGSPSLGRKYAPVAVVMPKEKDRVRAVRR